LLQSLPTQNWIAYKDVLKPTQWMVVSLLAQIKIFINDWSDKFFQLLQQPLNTTSYFTSDWTSIYWNAPNICWCKLIVTPSSAAFTAIGGAYSAFVGNCATWTVQCKFRVYDGLDMIWYDLRIYLLSATKITLYPILLVPNVPCQNVQYNSSTGCIGKSYSYFFYTDLILYPEC